MYIYVIVFKKWVYSLIHVIGAIYFQHYINIVALHGYLECDISYNEATRLLDCQFIVINTCTCIMCNTTVVIVLQLTVKFVFTEK